MIRFPLAAAAALAALLPTLVSPRPAIADAAAPACQMGLSFGIDTTGSLSPAQVRTMREQFAAALASPEILEVLSEARASVHVYEWAGPNDQVTIVDWTTPGDEAAIAAAAQAVGARTVRITGGTAIGAALLYGAAAIERSGCFDHALNIIADGYGVSDVYIGPRIEVAKMEIDPWLTINAVLIAGDRLKEMFETEVIQGVGSFIVLAEGVWDFSRAIQEKITREMNVRAMPVPPGPL